MADTMTLRTRAVLALSGKSALENLRHRQAWARVEEMIKASAKKTDKVFEVHHQIEAAREHYFEALIGGASPEDCAVSASTILHNRRD